MKTELQLKHTDVLRAFAIMLNFKIMTWTLVTFEQLAEKQKWLQITGLEKGDENEK